MVDTPDVLLSLDPSEPLGAPFRSAVQDQISTFLDEQRSRLAELRPEVDVLVDLAARLLAGGKRLRPAFCAWGYLAAVHPDPDTASREPAAVTGALLQAAASLELLHGSALVHDDVMDGSDTRRGDPSAHRELEGRHLADGRLGDPASFGRAGAILLGDLLVMWSVEMLERAGLPAAAVPQAQAVAQAMRTEVTCGQYLDVAAQSLALGSDPDAELRAASRVVEYKSARYTVYRPAQLGAVIGGGSPALLDALAAYGSPLGRAFQFRDDLLGVFGDPELTGKPVGDDLREGKRTVLIAAAMARTDGAGRRLLSQRLGDPDLDAPGVAALQRVIVDCGAHEAVETMIGTYYDEAVAALAGPEVSGTGRQGLTALASAAVHRTT